MKWLKGKEDHPVPFLAVSPGWCCCCDFCCCWWWEGLGVEKLCKFWLGVSCLVLVRVFFVYVKICLPFPKLALGTISQQGNDRFFFFKHQAWGIGFGLVASSDMSLGPQGVLKNPLFLKDHLFQMIKTHQYYSKNQGCLWANMKKHSTAFCSFLFSSTSPKSWCWYIELHLSDEVNVPLNVDGKKQKLAICWGDRCVTTNNTETTINRAFGEFLNLQNSIYFQEVFFRQMPLTKKLSVLPALLLQLYSLKR